MGITQDMRRRARLWAVVAGSIAVAACGAPGSGTPNVSAARSTPTLAQADCASIPPPRGAVRATERNYQIVLSEPTVEAGNVTFQIADMVSTPHTFYLLRTDLPYDELPTTANATVDLQSPQIDVVLDVDSVMGCEPKRVTADLFPGRYVAICNLPGHYSSGMRAPLVVTPRS